MSILFPETERAIRTHNIKLSVADRKALTAINDPERQMRWAVNPLFNFLLEQIQREMLRESNTNPPAAAPVQPQQQQQAPAQRAQSPVSDDDDGPGAWSLF